MINEILEFARAVYAINGKQYVKEITITGEAGLQILGGFHDAYRYVGIDGSWKEFDIQTAFHAIKIKNAEYRGPSMSSFDSIPFDALSKTKSNAALLIFKEVEEFLTEQLTDGRYKSLALTRLEEALMWINKAIRDEQNLRST